MPLTLPTNWWSIDVCKPCLTDGRKVWVMVAFKPLVKVMLPASEAERHLLTPSFEWVTETDEFSESGQVFHGAQPRCRGTAVFLNHLFVRCERFCSKVTLQSSLLNYAGFGRRPFLYVPHYLGGQRGINVSQSFWIARLKLRFGRKGTARVQLWVTGNHLEASNDDGWFPEQHQLAGWNWVIWNLVKSSINESLNYWSGNEDWHISTLFHGQASLNKANSNARFRATRDGTKVICYLLAAPYKFKSLGNSMRQISYE